MKVTSDTGHLCVVPDWAVDLEISDRAFRLYVAICSYETRSGSASVSRSELARRLGCSIDSVDRCVRELEEAGAITVERRQSPTGSWIPSIYHVSRSNPSRTGAARVAARLRLGSRTAAATPTEEREREGGTIGGKRESVEAKHVYRGMKDLSLFQELEASNTYATPLGVAPKGNRGEEGECERKEGGRSRPQDEIWDALVDALGSSPETRTERGRWNKAVMELREIGATPQEVAARCAEYRRRWPDIDLTPTALVANWATLATRAERGYVTARDLLDEVFYDREGGNDSGGGPVGRLPAVQGV